MSERERFIERLIRLNSPDQIEKMLELYDVKETYELTLPEIKEYLMNVSKK